jgi:diaminopimelate decarboxylase
MAEKGLRPLSHSFASSSSPSSPRRQPPSSWIDAPGPSRTRGAYCVERDLLSWRRLRFPLGVQVGDLVVFPNTAGYLMHILESASHQIPLARNVLVQGSGRIELDAIDARS